MACYTVGSGISPNWAGNYNEIGTNCGQPYFSDGTHFLYFDNASTAGFWFIGPGLNPADALWYAVPADLATPPAGLYQAWPFGPGGTAGNPVVFPCDDGGGSGGGSIDVGMGGAPWNFIACGRCCGVTCPWCSGRVASHVVVHPACSSPSQYCGSYSLRRKPWGYGQDYGIGEYHEACCWEYAFAAPYLSDFYRAYLYPVRNIPGTIIAYRWRIILFGMYADPSYSSEWEYTATEGSPAAKPSCSNQNGLIANQTGGTPIATTISFSLVNS